MSILIALVSQHINMVINHLVIGVACLFFQLFSSQFSPDMKVYILKFFKLKKPNSIFFDAVAENYFSKVRGINEIVIGTDENSSDSWKI